MRKIVLAVILLLCGASLLHGQIADTTSWRKQGEPTFVTGKAMLLGGAITAAAGGGLMLLAVSPVLSPHFPEDAFSENLLAPLVYITGMCAVIAGASVILAGVPVTIAGHSMMQCDVPWKDARYDTRGLGVILEGVYFLPDILQARAALGYHFNPHFFLGAGVAPGCWLDKSSRSSDYPRLTLPAYADFRWSMCNRLISPYLGFSAGMELTEISPYLGAELGTRIRTSRTSTRSFWSAISGEVAGGYMRLGIKMGYSF